MSADPYRDSDTHSYPDPHFFMEEDDNLDYINLNDISYLIKRDGDWILVLRGNQEARHPGKDWGLKIYKALKAYRAVIK